MSNKSSTIQLCKQYSQGERQFQNLQLENADLSQKNLSQIELSNSKLDGINFRQADLSQTSLIECSLVRANLSRANLSRAYLSGVELYKANLTGANIAGASFARANLSRANFSLARLASQKTDSSDTANFKLVNFRGANLTGAFFFGVDLSLANLKGAIYDKETNFPGSFDPVAAGMIRQDDGRELNLNKLLVYFNELFDRSKRYLGITISSKYFNNSRPEFDWLCQFQINDKEKIFFTKGILSFASSEQAKHFRQWIDNFITSCSKVIKDFPDLENNDDDDESLFSGFS